MAIPTDNVTTDAAPAPAARADHPRSVSIRLSTVGTAALLVSTGVLGFLYRSAESDLAEFDARAADTRHAEQVASNYAVGASTIDYKDTKGWLTRLKDGTTPQLAAKFDATGAQLEQILLPLQWSSKATPLSASVLSESGGIYKVNAYLNVVSTSAQTPDGAQTTVTYSLTLDRNADWKITDVGGLQNALPAK
ncbi:hypothetical protein [Nocardia inohanensis]|uniref:hypothetical protein n=1 Tax=Nocardia inohanensis TaxID=209246 RepID=UPI000A5D9BC6|nr:hypothetical protein [Nocardia inohanensis]